MFVFLKQMADEFTMSVFNYHQPVMGGTGPDSFYIGFGQYAFFTAATGNAATPPASDVYNPDPQAGTLNLYTQRAIAFQLLGS